MWLFDPESCRFIEVNPAATDLFGYSRSEFLNLHLDDIQLPERGPGFEFRCRLKNGSVLDVEITCRNIMYEGCPAVLSVIVDVTHRKRLEAQLLQAQKMEAVGMLAGGIAHDFNNLLTIITGYSQLVLASLPAGDRNHTAVEQIMKAGERAAALTGQLLAFSRRQVLQPRVLDLNVLVESLAVMLRRLIGEDIDLRLKLSPRVGQISADPGQVEQVVMNLAVNARDAMPKGGMLTLETRNVTLDENSNTMQARVKPGPYVMLAVTDSGTGMDEATRSRLFEPFFTTKAQGRGTGLGLSIVFGIMRQAGGNIEVSSQPGSGTSVRVYFPRVEQEVRPEPPKAAQRAESGGETILVVEDEAAVRKIIRETLEREGYRILDAAGPDRAGRICRTHPSRIHLMITDVVMPKESGRSLARRLEALRPDMKVLYISGYAEAESGGTEGVEEFLSKPFTPATLLEKVRQILRKANGGKTHLANG